MNLALWCILWYNLLDRHTLGGATQVIARVRPLREGSSREERRCVVTPDSRSVSIKEPQQTTPKQVSPLPPKLLLAPGVAHSFNFDFVAEEEATQQEVYEGECACPMPPSAACLTREHGRCKTPRQGSAQPPVLPAAASSSVQPTVCMR